IAQAMARLDEKMSVVSGEKMLAYRAAARKRCLRRRRAWAKRQEHARALAYQAAALLKEAFGAKRVVLFGSLAHGSLFDMRSDVDLAVWGLDGSKYYRAVSCLLDLDPTIEIDLVMAEEVSPGLLAVIKQEGEPL
ncbi:MAG: nucleotidyltransferase family protein, partial [Candidatus Binatia bacterium]